MTSTTGRLVHDAPHETIAHPAAAPRAVRQTIAPNPDDIGIPTDGKWD
jgi:hypothetical protein